MNYQKKYLLIKSTDKSNHTLYGYVLLEKDAGIWFLASFSFSKMIAKIFVFENGQFRFEFDYYNYLKKKLCVSNLNGLSFIIILDDDLVLFAGNVTSDNLNFVCAKQKQLLSANGVIIKIINKIFQEKKLSLYERIKNPMSELFNNAEKDNFLMEIFKCSFWVRVENNNKIDVIGKIKKGDLLLLGLGRVLNNPNRVENVNRKILHNYNGEIYEIEFFDVETGQTVNIDLLN